MQIAGNWMEVSPNKVDPSYTSLMMPTNNGGRKGSGMKKREREGDRKEKKGRENDTRN